MDEDIQKCTDYLESDIDENKGNALHLKFITKYPTYISRFDDTLYNYGENKSVDVRVASLPLLQKFNNQEVYSGGNNELPIKSTKEIVYQSKFDRLHEIKRISFT